MRIDEFDGVAVRVQGLLDYVARQHPSVCFGCDMDRESGFHGSMAEALGVTDEEGDS